MLQEAVLVVLPSLSQRVKRSRCLGIRAARNRAIGVVSIVVYGTRVNVLRSDGVTIVERPLHITTGVVVPRNLNLMPIMEAILAQAAWDRRAGQVGLAMVAALR